MKSLILNSIVFESDPAGFDVSKVENKTLVVGMPVNNWAPAFNSMPGGNPLAKID